MAECPSGTDRLAALSERRTPKPRTVEPVDQFDHVVELLAELDWDAIWNEAADVEKRTRPIPRDLVPAT